jgi:Acetyl-CoA hydrolase
MGSKRLYDFARENPALEMRTVDYVNNPVVVAQNTNLVCINSCLAVDFMGQVVSDSIGTKQFSGVGGQVDFVRGAAMTLDGKGIAIIAMPSVAIKKMVPWFPRSHRISSMVLRSLLLDRMWIIS